MNRIVGFLIIVFIFSACTAEKDFGPSSGAKDIPGALGILEYKPTDTTGTKSYWIDSDGVAPEIAGCHIGTDSSGKPNGRMFGEACLDSVILIESNPGIGELHSHAEDIGHPDKFDCNAFCVGSNKTGGNCEVTRASPCSASARCVCH